MKLKLLKKLMIGTIFSLVPITAFGAGVGTSTVAIQKNDAQFTFNPDNATVQSKGYNAYKEADGTPKVFTKDYYGGEFAIYTPYNKDSASPWNDMTDYIKENNQTSSGSGGAHLVPGYLNIKLGKQDPHSWGPTAYEGDGSGNFWIKNLDIQGEYRYQGYLKDATVIDNPFFPDDYYAGTHPTTYNWYQISQVTFTRLPFKATEFNNITNFVDDARTTTFAQKTFETWFANTEMGASFKEMTPAGIPQGQEWTYWNKIFQIQGDITDGSVIITGWHSVSGGRNYYMSFPVPSRPANNVTVMKFELVDKETGEVLENYYRNVNPEDLMNTGDMKVTKTDGLSVLDKDKEYILQGEILYTGLKNPSKDKKTLSQRPLKTIPPFMDFEFGYDANADKAVYPDLLEIEADTDGVDTSNVLPGTILKFKIDNYKVPTTVKKNGTILFTVPLKYLQNNDNSTKADDYSVIRFKAGVNDIGFEDPVHLIYRGQDVNYVVPGDEHNIVFNLEHVLGKTTIGLDPVTNPKATIDIDIKDTANNILQRETIRVSELLEQGKTIEVHSKSLKPLSDGIIACATINKVHAEKGLNSDPSNDKLCQTFKGVKNYAIKDFKITPHLIQLANGESSKTVPLSMNFIVANEGKNTSVTESPIVVIRQNGSVKWSGRIAVSVGSEVPYTVTLPASVGVGNNTFEVEVNPEPREVKEFRPNGLPPYVDNKKSDTVVVKKYEKCVECTNPRSNNSWTEKFSWTETIGEWKTYESCDGSGPDHGHTTITYCSTKSKSWSQIVSYSEEFKITNIYFRSKWSKDTRGGDGWIDLLKEPGNIGKIKAGYGFELKVVTNYTTNRNNVPSPSPVPWSECSYGLTRSPGVSPIDNPNAIYAKMPFSSNGNAVCYILDKTNATGSWYNSTKTFELPMRNSFNIKEERKIYVSEKATPKKYAIEIRTPVFDGYDPDVPVDVSNKKPMQGCKTIYLQVLPQDDLKSHIIQ